METAKVGRRSYVFKSPPAITAWASAVGKKEKEGPLGQGFPFVCEDSYLGQKTWEQGEMHLQQTTLSLLLRKAELNRQDLDLIFSGDLLNQCTASSFPLINTEIPHLGLYGACSTMAEALILSAVAASGGFGQRICAMASSHFCASERQYRFPLGYGNQRTPTAQWTVTGCGAALISPEGKGPRITGCTLGCVCSLGIKDVNNMGAAMAPSALSVLQAHFNEFGTSPEDYDQIFTGDLGQIGRELLQELALRQGLQLGGKLSDCGCMIFDNTRQNVNSGGSGAGCSACVLCSRLLDGLNRGEFHRILFCGTGALLSPTTAMQSLPIPGICHAVVIENKTGIC